MQILQLTVIFECDKSKGKSGDHEYKNRPHYCGKYII